jgi:DNA-binding PadR family transcriptional regulator
MMPKWSERLPVPSPKEALVMQLLVRGGELYGLQMVEQSEGELKRGTVYVTLERMEDKGYITSRQEERAPDAIGLPRRLYKLTGLGERVLHAWEAYGMAVVPAGMR